LLADLRDIVGERHVLTAADDMAPHLREWRDLFHGKAACVVKPGSTVEVQHIVRLTRAARVPLVPQGGNTGLVGGQIPMGDGQEVILSLTRMNAVRHIDADADCLVAEAGVTLANVQAAAESAGRLFPLSLASEGSCTIGGNLSTNAGGTAVLAYGNARDLCLGLEVVLADGRVWDGLSSLRKDNTGYDLKNLFIGAEGTLGVITAAALKLFPAPRARATAIAGLATPADALALFRLVRARAGSALTTFELMPRIGIDFVLAHAPGTRDPLAEHHAWYALVELSSPDDAPLDPVLETVLGEALESGVIADAALAGSLDQRKALWRLREALSEVQRFEGGSIKHDVSVPVSAVPAFLDKAIAACVTLIPGCRPVPFGHLGDGNIHFNVSQPLAADKAAFLARWDEVNDLVHGIVLAHGGSVSAEHGIGRLKRGLLAKVKDPVALDIMRALKRMLDPDGLMNPGAVL
jgi:FAD/FMN-containing dehydrogenase